MIAVLFDVRAWQGCRRPAATSCRNGVQGVTIQARGDLWAFMTRTRSLARMFHIAKRFGRRLLDLVLHGRGMHLRNGNALAARLMKSALEAAGDLRCSVIVTHLTTESGRV